MHIEMALKLRSYILDLDPWEFFFSEMESFFYQLSGSTFFCETHTPKSRKFNVWPNVTLPVAKAPWLFLGVQFNFF